MIINKTVKGGGKEEQEKSVTYTENGEYEVTPNEGKTLSSVSVTVDVPTSGGSSLPLSINKITNKDLVLNNRYSITVEKKEV